MSNNHLKNIIKIKVSIDLFILFTIINYYIGFSYSHIRNLLKWQENKEDLEEKPE